MSDSQRASSVSFMAMPPGVLANSRHVSEEDIQIALAPYIQTYLSQTGRRHSCCSVMLPVAFERAAPRSWLDPRFDSAVLEGQFQASVFAQHRLRFRFALFYILLCSLLWTFYFLTDTGPPGHHILIALAFGIVIVLASTLLWLTYSTFYRIYTNMVCGCTAIGLAALALLFHTLTLDGFSPLGHFSMCVEIVLLIYTVIPLRLWQNFCIATTYSIAFELLTHFLGNNYYFAEKPKDFCYKIMALRFLLQISVHLIGVHVLIMNVVRMRGTFMKVGQNLLVRRQLEMEKQLKEKMIHSVMPPKVADLLLKEGGPGIDNGYRHTPIHRDIRGARSSNDVKSLFRPFHMHSMDNVSILFADIVGFTKMSSTKTAEQLVEILNDLFERFDDLCSSNGCEKISTLGDCYYCVSGCPEPRHDHAICCVEMGLGMIAAMRLFDSQRHEGVKMRVGVHTGTVLCGIVGTRRVKFDVWSNDVSFANKMESSGRPEQVHISDKTSKFLDENYLLEEGEEVDGHQTYFVVSRKRERQNSYNTQTDLHPDHSQLLLVSQPGSNGFLCGVQLSQSATNVSAIHPSVPPASPVGQTSSSLNPSPNLSDRPRLASFNRVTKYLVSAATSKDKAIQAKPKIVVSTRSLPESLTSDREDDGCCRGGSSKANKDDDYPESTRKYSAKFLNWKVRKFLRKNDSASCLEAKKIEMAKRLDEVTCLDQNGYRPLPIVIETLCSNTNSLDVPTRSLTNRSPDNNSNSPAQHSMFDDIIDVRSYISQSRSDISPFGRSGSYRSQSGRSPNSDVSPIGRPRAATVAEHLIIDTCPSATTILTYPKKHYQQAICAVPPPAQISQSIHYAGADTLSICPSATSRKDSGIRSNSRRSSIQLQIYAANLSAISQQRVSGYFTSSQSSISELPAPVMTPTAPDPDPLGACLQQLRKQSDLQLIRCVRDNAKSQRSYFVKPPLTNVSLFFKSRLMEREFRSNAHRFGCERQYEGPPTLATPKYNTYIDIFVGIIVYFVVSASLFLLSLAEYNAPFRIWVSLFTVFSAVQFFALFLFTKQMCRMRSTSAAAAAAAAATSAAAATAAGCNSTTTNMITNGIVAATTNHHYQRQHQRNKSKPSCEDNFFEAISSWYPWHICLGALISLPVILIIVNFSLQSTERLAAFEYHYGFLIFVCIIHFCNFTQLNCWMRNVLATLAALAFVGIAIHQLGANVMRDNDITNRTVNSTGVGNDFLLLNTTTDAIYINLTTPISNVTTTPSTSTAAPNWFQVFHVELYIDLVLVLILVWFLNREFEIGYRLTFYGNAVANQDKSRVQMMKNQADMLLHNIIPKHVAEHLKNTAKYSENHRNVAIIFASIVNFNELYDESYLGGKEYLRVLNELIGDFDELLSRPEFRCIEKIKTIGSTFMAASGLDPSCRGTNNEHIVALMNFAFAMQSVIASFNKDLLEFNLILRIGFNVGDVTAGVIGTSKLHYDIWGDAVNVASRMDSTGVAGKIQVGKDCLSFIEDMFEYEARGKVYVKGKDHMDVYLIKGRKSNEINGGFDYDHCDPYGTIL